MLTIGLDAHLRTSTLCILEQDGSERKCVELRCGPDGVIDYLRRLDEPFQVAFEASANYGYLHDGLAPFARDVQVAHAGKLAPIYKSKQKYDRHDARIIAQLLKVGILPGVWVPPVELREWRRLIEYRRSLVGKRVRAKNAVRALLRTHAVKPPPRLWTKGGVLWLSGLEPPSATEKAHHHAHGLTRADAKKAWRRFGRAASRSWCNPRNLVGLADSAHPTVEPPRTASCIRRSWAGKAAWAGGAFAISSDSATFWRG